MQYLSLSSLARSLARPFALTYPLLLLLLLLVAAATAAPAGVVAAAGSVRYSSDLAPDVVSLLDRRWLALLLLLLLFFTSR